MEAAKNSQLTSQSNSFPPDPLNITKDTQWDCALNLCCNSTTYRIRLWICFPETPSPKLQEKILLEKTQKLSSAINLTWKFKAPRFFFSTSFPTYLEKNQLTQLYSLFILKWSIVVTTWSHKNKTSKSLDYRWPQEINLSNYFVAIWHGKQVILYRWWRVH